MTDAQTEARAHVAADLSLRTIFRFWFPLSASWLLMSAEMPVATAFIARMPVSKLQLAAFGVATSLALAIESPIISMLTASNAMIRDRQSFRLMYRFMIGLNVLVTLGMLCVSLTPLFDLVVIRLIGTPVEVAALVRPTLLAMTTWPAAVGYRRFFQGIMIRHSYTQQMTYGTALRLAMVTAVAALGLVWGRLNGTVIGGLALAASTLTEAVAVHFWSRPAVRQVRGTGAAPDQPPLTIGSLIKFYLPLTLTAAVNLSTTPLLNLGMARARYPIESLAVWPVINGQLFISRSFGFSLQEAVVALLDRPNSLRKLRQFAAGVGIWSLALMGVIALTPAGPWWQKYVAGLSDELAGFAIPTLRLVVLLPALAAAHSWFRGIVVFGKKTGTIAVATAINLVVLATVLIVGIKWGGLGGLFLSAMALTLSQGTEAAWLWFRARLVQRQLQRQTQAEAV